MSVVTTPSAQRAPQRLRDEVLRPRLFDLLDVGVRDRALTLVSAPPGAGKTVLLTSWLREREPRWPVVWLTLQEGDHTSIWAPLLAAVGESVRPQALASDSRRGDTGLATHFADLLVDLADPLVLAVDDLHNASPAALASLDRLLHSPPAQLRIVAASRLDPPLPLHVLRLTGDLAELRASDLAFDEGEARELFRNAGVDVDDRELKAILDRTEGWAAGLRLFAISLADRPDRDEVFRSLDLDERPVSEYLTAEVLATQPAEIRDFLIRTSVVVTLDGELANALTGRTDGERVLEQLCRENLFLERLPGTAATYRYHQLFRALLVAEASYELGDELASLHERAAVLLAQRGQPLAAVQHAVQGERWDLVSTLLAEHWPAALAADPDHASSLLLGVVPPEYAASSPVVGAFSALLRLAGGDARRASALLASAVKARERVPRPGRAGFDSLTRYASALAARARGNFQQAGELAAELVERAPVEAISAVDEDRRRGLGLVTLGVSQLWLGMAEEAQSLLEEAVGLTRSTRDGATEADALAHLALVELQQGRLRRGARLARAALALGEARLSSRRPAALVAHTGLAFAHHQWGDDDAADVALEAAEAIAKGSGDQPGRVLVTTVAARISASRGGESADDAILQLRAMCSRSRAATYPFVRAHIAAIEARLLGETARFDEATAILADVGSDGHPAVVAARLHLAQGAPAQALAVLKQRRPALPALELEAVVTEAVAHYVTGERARAVQCIDQALALAEPEVVRRPFLEAGLPARDLLADHLRATNTHRWLASELVAALDGRLRQAAPAELLEPLSDREREVLRYLPSIMSNADIAAELFVSVNTVKTHVKSIYRKLGATRRQDAVRCARQLGLL
jgi:LuxR family maltose regulon positive regulatory protein